MKDLLKLNVKTPFLVVALLLMIPSFLLLAVSVDNHLKINKGKTTTETVMVDSKENQSDALISVTPEENVAPESEIVKQPEAPVIEEPVAEETPVAEVQKKEYTQAELEEIFDLKNKVAGTKIFYSKNLGIGFTYLPIPYGNYKQKIEFIEAGNVVRIKGSEFDNIPRIEVFEKNPNQTLKQAIEERFLKGINPEKCFVEDKKYGSTNSEIHDIAIINYETIQDADDNPYWFYSYNCSSAEFYALDGGGNYFLEDKLNPNKYAHIKISSQDGTTPDGTKSEEGRQFTESIRFLK